MRRLLPLLMTALLAGCVSSPAPFSATSSQQALVRWSKPNNTLVCEAVVSRAADSAVRVQLYKGSPKALVTFSLDANNKMQASGPMAGLGWRGVASSAPLPLSTWSRFLQDYQAAPKWPNGDNEIHSGDSRTAVSIVDRQVRTLSVSNNLSGETITAKFRAP